MCDQIHAALVSASECSLKTYKQIVQTQNICTERVNNDIIVLMHVRMHPCVYCMHVNYSVGQGSIFTTLKSRPGYIFPIFCGLLLLQLIHFKICCAQRCFSVQHYCNIDISVQFQRDSVMFISSGELNQCDDH